MAKRRRDSDSDGTTTEAALAAKTVFMDTNLDTHLALIVSDSDTVSDVKEKIMFEHPRCFPEIGEIKVHALKVKRRGNFYHLSDSMLVRSAFEATKKNWFLSVDALSLKQPSEKPQSCNANATNQVSLLCIANYPSAHERCVIPDSRRSAIHELPLLQHLRTMCEKEKGPITDQPMLIESCSGVLKDVEVEGKCTSDDHCKNFFSEANRWHSDHEGKEKYDVVSEENKFLEMNAEDKDGNSKDGICDVQCNNSKEQILRARPSEKKKHKSKKHNADAVSHHIVAEEALKSEHMTRIQEGSETPLEEDKGLISDSNKESSKLATVISENSAEHKQKSKFTTANYLTEPSEIDNVRVSSGSKKRKKKKVKENSSISHDQVVAVVPSVQDFGDKNSMETAQTNCKLTNASIIPRGDVHHETLSEPVGISQKQKHSGALQKVAEEEKMSSSPIGSDACEPYASDIQRKNDPLEQPAEFEVKGTKKLKKYHGDSMKAVHPLVMQELHNLNKDACHSADKNIVPEHHGFGTNQNENILEEIELPLNNDPEEMLSESSKPLDQGEADVNTKEAAHPVNLDRVLESGASGGSKRKTRVKKSATKNQDALCMKHANNALGHVSSTLTDSVVDNLTVETTKDKRTMPHADSEQPNKIEELIISANPPDANGVMGSLNSGSSRRIKKRAKKSALRNQEASDVEHAKDSVSVMSIAAPCAAFDDVTKEANVSSYTERKKVEQQKSTGAVLASADKESDNVSRNEAEHLPSDLMDKAQEMSKPMNEKSRKKVKRNGSSIGNNLPDLPIKVQGIDEEYLHMNQIDKTSENAEDLNKFKKKTKKNQNTAAKSSSDIPIMENEAGDIKLAASDDGMREVGSTSRAANITSSSRRSSTIQLIGSELELEKNIEMSGASSGLQSKNIGMPCASFDPQSVDSSLVLSAHALEDNCRGRTEDEINTGNHMEGSNCECDDINFKHYFVPGQYQNEASPTDEIEETRSDKDSKAAKKAKKVVVPHVDTSPAIERSLKLYEDHGSEKKSRLRNSSNIQIQKTSSKDDYIEVMHQSNKKSTRGSESRVKAAHFDDIVQNKTPPEDKHFDVVNSSGNKRLAPNPKSNNESSAKSSSSSSSGSKRADNPLQNKKNKKRKSSLDRYRVAIRKPSSKNTGEGGNSSLREKRLLSTPAAIFKDGSSGSSTNEDGTVDSDASTCSPSDDSSSSSYSEGESKSNLNSATNEPNGAKTKEGGGKVTLNSQLSGSKNITMDMILRSSSRFKKARLTASKSQQEDTGSQPVEFVPDSQTNL